MEHSAWALKRILKATLRHPVVGRPLRKMTWLLHGALRRSAAGVAKVYERLPYVVSLNHSPAARLHKESEALEKVLGYLRTLATDLEYQPLKPKISVLLPVYNTPHAFLRECLLSVASQVYDNWELCIVDDCSTDPGVAVILREFAAQHGAKVKLAFHSVNQHISAASNSCLAMASGDYVALLDHDDRLYPSALGEVVRHINWLSEPDILYSDEESIDAAGEPKDIPFFKPGWSPQLHLRVNYTTHLSVYRRQLLTAIGGFRLGFEGAQDHDLMLRAVWATSADKIAHIPLVLYQWRAHGGSTAAALESKPYAASAGIRCIEDHLTRVGRAGSVGWEQRTQHYRVEYRLPEPPPLVSIVICTKDRPDLITGCLDSIFLKSTYPNYEIVLVDNQSTDPQCLALFRELESDSSRRTVWLKFEKPFNFAAMNNLGVEHARGTYVILLNNDTVVLEPRWIEELVQLAMLPEVGAVGPKLLYADGRVQHAGLVLADHLVALHMGLGAASDDDHYWNLMNTTHEVAAVTGACLCVAKDTFQSVGGLRPNFVPNGYGDVDFCLRLLNAGFSNVYTPHARLTHFESPTRKVSYESFERHFMTRTHGQLIVNDPYFNPNFLRSGVRPTPTDFNMAFQLSGRGFRYLVSTPREQWAVGDFRLRWSQDVQGAQLALAPRAVSAQPYAAPGTTSAH